MKLPILVLVLVALGQAASPPPTTKPSATKSSDSKKNSNQTSKRELYEGNFGDKKELGIKYAVSSSTPKVEFSDDLKKVITEENSAAAQIFGVRLPQIAKISDVLSGQGPSFEAAVAKHLYSPISVYQARIALPTSFEVPAASQSAYQKPKPFKLQRPDSFQKIPEDTLKGLELTNEPLQTVKQPKFRFEPYPQSGLSNIQAHIGIPQEIFRPQQLTKQPEPDYFPVLTSEHLGPIRFQSLLPSQYLEQNKVYQLVPVNSGFAFGNQDENNEKGNSNQENQEQTKSEPTARSLENNAIPVHKQGYHAHPNGAISFASFSQNLPVNTPHESVPQSPPGNFNNQPVALPPSPQPIAFRLQPELQKLGSLKDNLQYPQMLNKIMQDLQKYQPHYHPDLLNFKPQVQNEPRALNSFHQNSLVQDPRQLPHPQLLGLQRLPAFKALPQLQLTPESYYQHTSPAPISVEPKPFGYDEHSTQTPSHVDQPIAPVSPQRQYTPLPPLKPNYNKHVKPLKQRDHTTSVFLPTPSKPLSSSTPNVQPEPDQIISSTTVQPDVKDNENDNLEWKDTDKTSDNENIPQSEQTVIPLSIQSTSSTYQPQVLHESQSEYQSTIRPQGPRHDVVIQRQEVQEIIFDPSPQTSEVTLYQQQQNPIRINQNQQEQEVDQLQSQEHHQLLEQLQPLHYQQEVQDPDSQYRLAARHLQNAPKQYAIQQIGAQQYQIQPYSYPLQFYQLQTKPLQRQQNKLEQSQQQQQEVEQTQSQQYQLHNLEPKSDAQPSTPKPEAFKPQDSERQSYQVETQNQQDSDVQSQEQSKLQPTTDKPNEQSDNLSESGPSFKHSYYEPLLSSHFPRIFAPPQQLLAQPEYDTQILNVPSYPEVQYFGKFAQALFGNGQH